MIVEVSWLFCLSRFLRKMSHFIGKLPKKLLSNFNFRQDFDFIERENSGFVLFHLIIMSNKLIFIACNYRVRLIRRWHVTTTVGFTETNRKSPVRQGLLITKGHIEFGPLLTLFCLFQSLWITCLTLFACQLLKWMLHTAGWVYLVQLYGSRACVLPTWRL